MKRIDQEQESSFFEHHGLWAPGVRLFRRLRFRDKALAITLAFMVPFGMLLVVYLRDRAEAIAFVALERDGIAYARPLLQLMPQLQALRRGQGSAPDLSSLEAAQREYGAQLATEKSYQALKSALAASPGRSGIAAFQAHDRAARAALDLLTVALDHSGLMLDPMLDTYYLMDGGLVRLPRLRDASAASVDLQTLLAAEEQASLRQQLVETLVLAEPLLVDLSAAIDKVRGMHGDAAWMRELQPATLQRLQTLLRTHKDLVLAGGSGVADWQATATAMDAELAQVGASLFKALDHLLAEREADLRSRRVGALAISAAFLLLAAYLFLSFAKVMNGGLREVRRHLRAMTEGDLTTTPSPWGSDEAARLMLALREMQDALRAIVSQVREGASSVVTASTQIASGAMDLSARSEQTAANLEESAASMEEVGSTVRSTAEHAQQAAQLALHNADVAIEGGQVMASMVATMQEIDGASKRINDIIGTIDSIAFQTNILALNAAVEAARAGEQGRGFAVVASEVRSLAQRSATAAREIKSLIVGSTESVERGAAVVAQAQQSIDQIVQSSQSMQQLLGDIAVGAREQATGVTQVSEAVAELDRMTQQNAALVEETAAASASLRDQANALSERVSSFVLPEGATYDVAAVGIDFDAAAEAHRRWKTRLRNALNGGELPEPETVCRDDQCELGRWLHGVGRQRWGNRPGFSELLDDHKAFHQAAGDIARLIQSRSTGEAARRLDDPQGEFSKRSRAVISELSRAKYARR